MACAYFLTWMVVTWATASCELLQNGNFENGKDHWDCFGMSCTVLDASDSHEGSHAIRTHSRTHYYQGPSQEIHVQAGKDYHAESWVKVLNDLPNTLGQKIELEVSFNFPDNSNRYLNIAMRPMVRSSDGWIKLHGEFQAPPQAVRRTKFYYQGPKEGVDFAVDQASVTEVVSNPNWRNETDAVIEKIRKSDIHVHVTTSGNIDDSAVQIQILQTKKSFPFGMVVSSKKYVDPALQKYRDFLHTHFNWAVPGNALKWRQFDLHQPSENPGDPLYDRALNTLKGLQQAGLKIRGHNMVWSVGQFIPNSVKAQSGDQLRTTVRNHINYVMNVTKGYLEHWDVNNENLHGQWFQERLQDRDYDLELFRMMYAADHHPTLFLNDYNVVAQGATTDAYLAQGKRFKNAANVHLGGMGVQCHFKQDQEPNPTLMKQRLDLLATVGVPIWATELTVSVSDDNKAADYFEKALRALYGHPAVEGIMFWGLWASEPDMVPTVAGRRVLDLLENQWMTDQTFTLSQSGNSFDLRGFHGDYEVHVLYNGHELRNLRQTFTLGTQAKNLNINVHQ